MEDKKTKIAVVDASNPQMALYAAAYADNVKQGIEVAIVDVLSGGAGIPDYRTTAAKLAPPTPHIPNRVSVEANSPYFFHGIKKMGCRLNGIERNNDVVEFDVKAGWIRVHVRNPDGKLKAERGKWVCIKLRGVVEPYWKS